MRYHLTLVRMAIIRKSTNRKCKLWWGCGENRTLVRYWWDCKLVQSLWKTVWRILRKLKIELPYDPAIPLLGIHPKEIQTLFQKDICIPMFIAALFTIAKIWKQPKLLRWMDIEDVVYIHNKILLSHKKNEILSFVTTWMDLESVIQSEVSQTEKDKYHEIAYMWNL